MYHPAFVKGIIFLSNVIKKLQHF